MSGPLRGLDRAAVLITEVCGNYFLQTSRAFHLHAATRDHGSSLDSILNRKSKAHGGARDTHRYPPQQHGCPEAACAEGMGRRLCQPPPLKHCGFLFS